MKFKDAESKANYEEASRQIEEARADLSMWAEARAIILEGGWKQTSARHRTLTKGKTQKVLSIGLWHVYKKLLRGGVK